MAGATIYRTSISVLAFVVLVVTSQDSSIEIICGSGDTCVQKYTLNPYEKFFRYEGSENLAGVLQHGLKIAASGKCFTPKFVFRGLSDLLWASWDLPELDTPTPVKTLETREDLKEFYKKKGIPIFFRKKPPPLNLCQSIVASREIEYKPCGGTQECERTSGGNCRRFYTTSVKNPVLNWLNKKAEDGNYPTVEIANKTHISIDWGKAEEFRCGEDIRNSKTNKATKVGGEFRIVFEGPDDQSNSTTITHDRFKFEKDHIGIDHLPTLDNPKCFTFSVKISLKLKFLELESGADHSKKIPHLKTVLRKSEELSTIIPSSLSSKGPNGKNDLADNSKIKTVNKTEAYLFIQHEDNEAPINCLQKKVTVKNMHNNDEREVEIIDKRKVDLTSFIVVPCEETKIKISARNTQNEVVIEKYFKYLPTVNVDNTNTSTEDGAFHLIVNEAKFENCPDLKFEVVCEAMDMDNNVTKILGYNNKTKKSDEFKMEGSCKARAFLCEGTNETCTYKNVESEWIYVYGKPSPKVSSNTAIGSVMGSIFGVLAIAAAVVMFMRFKEKKTREENKERLLEKVKVKTESGPIPQHVVFKKMIKQTVNTKVISSPIPDHFVFTKDENLRENLMDIIGLHDEIIEEFQKLEKFEEETILSKETTKIATKESNVVRNRYKDILPYDSNVVLIKKGTGIPVSRYINASLLQFNTWDQKFLVVQAPKPDMYSSFWQLAMEQNVFVIVMITKMMEAGKRKAHKYWPDDSEGLSSLDNGMKVEFLSQDKTSPVFHHRQFKVTDSKQKSRHMHHLQCVSWEDKSCPNSSKTMKDLTNVTRMLVAGNPAPIMVHCSAGVGRTGAFIAYYKLAEDLDNEEVDRIDPFETVLEMRKGRARMVQKPVQYYYVIKCLSDYVNEKMRLSTDQEGETNNNSENPSPQNRRINDGGHNSNSPTPIQTIGGLDVTGSQMSAGRDIVIQGPTNTFNEYNQKTQVNIYVQNDASPEILSQIVNSVNQATDSSNPNEAVRHQNLAALT